MKTLIVAASALILAFPAYAQVPTAADRAANRDAVSNAPANATLTGKVKSALAADVGLKTLKINVDSDKGAVTLKGRVDSADNKKRAGDVAKKVEGVKSVKNQLRVNTPKS
jgi:osmotically-inducible protein OsmY